MRIDYSEPRRSYTSSSSGPVNLRSTDNRSKFPVAIFLIAAGVLLFVTGFATGWYFSQISAKKAFRAAMEQKSLENTPKEEKKTPSEQQQQQLIPPPVTGVAPASPSAPPQAGGQQTPPQGAAQPATGPNAQPLSFYKNLQTGQKNTVLGSGINAKPRPAAPPQQPGQQGSPALAGQKEPAAGQPKAPPHTGGYLVQVAAFKTFEEAKKLRKDLTDKGYSDVTVSEATLNDNATWYRVRIGRHLDREVATKIANKLMSSAKVLPDTD